MPRALNGRPITAALAVTLLALGSPAPAGPSLKSNVARHATPAEVALIINTRSADSVAIGESYAARRRIPAANICHIECDPTEEVSMAAYKAGIEKPVRAFLSSHKGRIDYIVVTRGLPIRTAEGPSGGFSTDGLLVTLDWPLLATRSPNPYYGRHEAFSHAKYRLYLVSRLTGYTRQDALSLIDHSMQATPANAPFLFHTGPGHDVPGYAVVNMGMRSAHRDLVARNLGSTLDEGPQFTGGVKNLMGYFSWGSNDPNFSRAAYNSLTFRPGGIAESAVSTSARTFEDRNASGQSLIADLITQGVTGCKGYVSEPYADSIAHSDILFDRYTEGYNLAESFYMASAYVHWKDMVIGDPLCAPYAR